ncbi:LytTR family DNA-binding domain-containing protein [Pedobacter aquatilis]|uniref:LytTR family DNA-binding domain-containing protein n=1 Tax=Pedobacter aquatilis TaxID=351343 RepID=UPI002931224E|nr:LytTR family DNA-binding domain-containing protein [Pedobacter aquatilis]
MSWEYVHLGMVFLLTGMANFLMRDIIYYNRNNWSWFYLKEELINSFVAGTLFYFMFRLASFYFQSKKGDPFVLQFTPLSVEPEKFAPPLKLFIKTKVKQDDFSLILSDLLFARAEGNYLELTCYQNGQIKNELKRISLTAFNTQVSQHPGFFRCHRAYLVNMRWIENVSGNAQGYLLGFNYTQTKVPVSRAQLEDFNNLYKQLQENTII